MKQNFTKIIFLFFFLGLNNFMFAQKFIDIEVTGSGNTLSAEAIPASFGSLTVNNYFEFETVTADLMIIDDGTASPTLACSPAINALTGSVAIIDRADCSFVTKCRNAQDAGAIVALVCNNVPGEGAIVMGGDDAEDITIPCMMISQEECNSIRVLVEGGAQAVISNQAAEFDDTEMVFWGDNPGEGDFAGGLNDWETMGLSSDTAVWIHTELGISDGPITGNSLTFSIVSPTGGDGAAIFDSEFYNRAIITEGSTASADQMSELISPTIDCSSCQSTKMSFFQYNVPLNGTTSVAFSGDDGVTWSDPEEVTTENILNSVETNIAGTEKREVNIPSEFNTAQFRMKFIFDGDFYFWMVDDVRIVEREANNLRVNENFFAVAPNVRVPRSQVDAINFLADIQNVGAADQESATLSIRVTNDATGAEVFSDGLNLGRIEADSLIENTLFPNQFTPAAEIASYTGVYRVSADVQDFDESDNTRTINFSVTENEFANEDGTGLNNIEIVDKNQIPTWSFGNYFYLPRGNGYKVAGFGIGIGNASVVGGLEVGVRMFKWTDSEEPGTAGFGVADPSEREFIGFSDYEILGNELPADVNIIEAEDIFNADGDELPILLDDDANYLVMLTMDSEVGISGTNALLDSYSAMNLASTFAGAPRYWSFFGDGSDIFTTDYVLNAFVPLVRMFIEPEDASSVTALSADNLIEVTPNPASEFVNISMDFTKSFDHVNVMMTDITGRVVLMKDLNNVKNHQMRIDVGNLLSGTFILNITTPDGVRTEKFIKVD